MVALAAVTWLATRVLVVKSDLEAAQSLVLQLQADLTASDFASLEKTSQDLQDRSSSAVNGTHDLTWRVAEFTPLAGNNLTAVRYVAESIDSVVRRVAVPAVGVAITFDRRADDGGQGSLNLTPIVDASEIALSAQTVFAESREKLGTVDAGATIGPIAAAVRKLDGLLTSASNTLDDAAPLLEFAAAAVGGDTPKNFLLAFQNNAESTALGGSAASFTMLTVDDGSFSISAQAGSRDFPPDLPVDVSVDDSALGIYSDYLVSHLNTSTSRPDFPTAAKIMKAYWERDIGTPVAGVISIDPIALSRMLIATGPLTLPSGDILTSDNAVQLLVNEVYFRYDSYLEPEKVDAFFESAAAAVLSKITSADFEIAALLAGTALSVDQGSLMMWSPDEAEQSLLDGARIQGVLPSSNEESTVIGAYYRDVSASKIDYYLETETSTTSDACTNPTSPTFTTSVTLHSTLTKEQARALPDYIQGYNFGAEMFRTQVFVYGPVGATVAESSVDADGSTAWDAAADLGRPVASFEVDLAPGEKSTVTATFTGAPGDYGPLEIRGTPMINRTPMVITPESCG